MLLPFTLDQLTVFLAVVEEGSFSAAGRRLGRVQSAVSYAIAQLEQAVESPLFDRSGRSPVLTARGHRLAAEARLVTAQARSLAETAAALHRGVESQLRLVVDAIFPEAVLADACAAFRSAFPHTGLRLEVGVLRDAVGLVRAGAADLGVCNLAGLDETELHAEYLTSVRLVPVCAPSHPLAKLAPPHRAEHLRQHVQVVHTERRDAPTRDQGVLASRTWRVTELPLKVDLLVRGVGWGSVPEDRAAPLLASGCLVRLHPELWPDGGHLLPLHALSRRDAPPGPAGTWWKERLRTADPTASVRR